MAVSSGVDDAGISAREAEVLAAVGEHLTNAEIAARLFISVRTVESHVSSLLRKLGADDRRSLARLADAGEPDGSGSAAATGPAPGDPPATAAPLPAPLTPFVGRAAERAALAKAVTEARLVTALGPGGVGKTRLALAVAGEVVDRFSGRVWYVDLVPVTGPAMVTAAIAAALGVGEVPGQALEETVTSRIGPAPGLLVLDNCEHLVDGVAALVERLLTRCAGLTVLATSRIRLVLPFERPFPVPGLSVDEVEPAGDAVALFMARAAAVGVTLDAPDHRARVASVCRALDGMALAIELATSRLPSIGLDGLEAGLGDRLRVLTGGSRADERHRSLRATLDWSYNLATPEDRAVLRRVATFAAPFSAAAAVDVVAGPAPRTTPTTRPRARPPTPWPCPTPWPAWSTRACWSPCARRERPATGCWRWCASTPWTPRAGPRPTPPAPATWPGASPPPAPSTRATTTSTTPGGPRSTG